MNSTHLTSQILPHPQQGRTLKAIDFTKLMKVFNHMSPEQLQRFRVTQDTAYRPAFDIIMNDFDLPLLDAIKIVEFLSAAELSQLAVAAHSYPKLRSFFRKIVQAHPQLDFLLILLAPQNSPAIETLLLILAANVEKYGFDHALEIFAIFGDNVGSDCEEIDYADLSNFNLQNNFYCFVNRLQLTTFQKDFVFDASRLNATRTLIEDLHFQINEAFDVIYHYFVDDEYMSFNIPPKQKLLLGQQLMIELMETYKLTVFEAKQTMHKVAVNSYNRSLEIKEKVSAFIAKNAMHDLHILALETRKLNATQNLLTYFQYGIREAFAQTQDMSMDEIKEVNSVPLAQVRTATGVILSMMQSAPILSCITIQDAITKRLTFLAARDEAMQVLGSFNQRYIGNYRSILQKNGVKTFHLYNMISTSVRNQLERKILQGPSTDLTNPANVETVQAVARQQAVWNNLTDVLKFNCIESRELFFQMTAEEMAVLPSLANNEMQKVMAALPWIMLEHDFLALSQTRQLKRIVESTLAELALPALAAWDINKLLSLNACAIALKVLQDFKDNESISYQQHITRNNFIDNSPFPFGDAYLGNEPTLALPKPAIHDNEDFHPAYWLLSLSMLAMVSMVFFYKFNPVKEIKKCYRNSFFNPHRYQVVPTNDEELQIQAHRP